MWLCGERKGKENPPGAGVSPGDRLHIADEHTEFQGAKDLPKVAELERS